MSDRWTLRGHCNDPTYDTMILTGQFGQTVFDMEEQLCIYSKRLWPDRNQVAAQLGVHPS